MASAGEKHVAIDISSATTTTVISTAADEYFNVVKLFLHASGANAATLKSASTVLCGKLDLVAQERFFLESADGVSLLRGAAVGDDFTIVTTTTAQLSGFVVYKITN
jgi:xanthine dehydrogenase molybdopterin-binding subunit B